ncbi:uncharacterized protein LOC111496965 [Cucurbita maxima]|uniref:Uncharacterized protein LOC111496965 n=1 Tax=Cucurbita maxima TaxID=3661 RepID=A0A6J1KM51_CUCMA|nr:uncharacterized protein LOC111496965 [Cucurbita maxima]
MVTQGSGSSAVSCKQSPNEGEFLDYQSSELRTADRECFLTHSGGWDSKSPMIVNCPSLEPETALASEPEPNLEPEPEPYPKLETGCEAESFPKSEDKLVEEKHLESDNGQREVESENLDEVQKCNVVVEAESLDKSMDVAKEREACSDDADLSESRDVSIDLGNCSKDERDVVTDEGDKLENSLLDDECKESKDLNQEVKTKDFDKEVEKEIYERGSAISKPADPPLSSQEAKVENPPDLVTPPDASAEKEVEEESTEMPAAMKKKKRRQNEL